VKSLKYLGIRNHQHAQVDGAQQGHHCAKQAEAPEDSAVITANKDIDRKAVERA
jgi:hypothetical protein